MRLLPITALLLLPLAADAQVYRHVDASGKVTFTDRPPTEAEPVALPPVNALPLGPRASTAREEGGEEAPPAPAAVVPYTSLVVTGFDPDTVLRDPAGGIGVQAQATPPLQPGHRLVLSHNGQPADGDSLYVETLERGTHSFVAEIIDEETGAVLIRSQPLQLHVHRTSVLHRNHPGRR